MSSKNKQLAQFILAGGLAALVNLLVRAVLSNWMSYSTAIVIAFVFGISTAFLLNKAFVFRNATNRIHHQIFWFVVINLAGLLQTLFISIALHAAIFPFFGFTWHPELVAHGIGVITPIFVSYLGHKYLSFPTVV